MRHGWRLPVWLVSGGQGREADELCVAAIVVGVAIVAAAVIVLLCASFPSGNPPVDGMGLAGGLFFVG